MRKISGVYSARPFSDRRWLLPFFASFLVSLTLLMATVFVLFSSLNAGNSLSLDIVTVTSNDDPDGFSIGLDRKILLNQLVASLEEEEEAPRIAYLITGTKGDSQRMRRTLQAIYDPRNQYILHLDLEAPPRERIDLTMYVKGDLLFSEVENVRMIVKANLVTYKGPTMIACSLHAISILLKEKLRWRARPIIVDPGLYLSKKFDVFTSTERRELPTSFKLYTGSAWVMLTRCFLEYCIQGWENLPRTVLMYCVNFISSPEGCFHTVICNSDAFRNTSISHDLHYINWDNPPKQHPLYLTSKDFDRMVKSGICPLLGNLPNGIWSWTKSTENSWDDRMGKSLLAGGAVRDQMELNNVPRGPMTLNSCLDQALNGYSS